VQKATQFKLARESEAFWRVTFDNPPINLLNPDAIRELGELVTAMETDDRLKVVVFDSANPDYFISHYDMSRAGEAPAQPGPTGMPPWADFTLRLAQVSVVSIAAVRGRVRGAGSEFTLACDLRFASREKAIFGQPEVGVGLVPGGGAMERLPLLMGRARALEVLLGSDDFDAALAERYGWVNRAVPDAELDALVDNLVSRIVSFDRQALAAAKQLLNRTGLPNPEHLKASRMAFIQSIGWKGAQSRAAALVKGGLGKPGDFELRLGHHIGQMSP
jgi:enoyl-CoA hydratase/carnithine racemase